MAQDIYHKNEEEMRKKHDDQVYVVHEEREAKPTKQSQICSRINAICIHLNCDNTENKTKHSKNVDHFRFQTSC